MKQWRPPNWENPHKQHYDELAKIGDGGELLNELVKAGQSDFIAYEAGADAILKSLKEDGVFTYGHHTPDIPLEDSKEVSGYWVFIPDEVKDEKV